jgi:WD40 repeat protein
MADHPPRESLERLLAETLDDSERALVEAHVEHCSDCQNTLHKLTLGAAGPVSNGSWPAKTNIGQGLSNPDTEAFFDNLKRIKPIEFATTEEEQNGSESASKQFAQVEGYSILEVLGRGATGVVYRARHLRLNRLVALKVIVAGPHLSPEVRQRFRSEAQAIARLQHANIVQIYDVGEHANFPFLSLELIDGGNLADWLAGKPRPAREAAKVIATLAKAVAYAHGQGVIHRDLKPANVLISTPADRARKLELKITDFGIAKILPAGGVPDARMTQTGEILGTPAYMAPEQARGNAREISPATDIYSLGAMLYEMLTGRPPFQGPTPLDTLMQAAWQDPVSICLLVPPVPRDLETICLKCLEKDPAKRYSTAKELAADLGRFLKNEPIHARPLSWGGHTIRWVRRHRGLAAGLAGVAVLLVLIAFGSLVASAHFRKLEQQQRQLALEKSELADEKEKQRVKAVAAEQREASLRREAVNEGHLLRQNLYFNQMNLGAQAVALPGAIGRVGEWLAPWAHGPVDLRNWEWYYLDSLCHRDLHTLYGHVNGVRSVAWNPDSRRVASGGVDGSVRIWDAVDPHEIRLLSGHTHEVTAVAWSPDGHQIASASFDGSVKIWNADTGEAKFTFGGNSELFAVAWSPDGKRVAAAGATHTIRIWDSQSGKMQKQFDSGAVTAVHALAWSPDGQRLASGDEAANVQIWDPLTGSQVLSLRGHSNFIRQVAWSPDGKQLASASHDCTVKIWDVQTGAEKATLKGHTLAVVSVAWSPDGTRLATASDDQTVKVWLAADGSELFTLRGHTMGLTSVAWSPDGAHLVSGGWDATIKIWNADAGPEVPSLAGHTGMILGIAWSPDGARLASCSADQTIRIWDAVAMKEQAVLRGHTGWVHSVAWSPDGTRIASAEDDHSLRIWDPSNGNQLNSIHLDAAPTCVAWSPDRSRLASSDSGPTIHIWDPVSGKQLQRCEGHVAAVCWVAWSPDGKRLASASADHSVRMWDPETGQQIFAVKGHVSAVKSVAWSHDGQHLASSSEDETIEIWNAATGQVLTTLRGHTGEVTSVVWSPDDTRLASVSDDRTIKLWDSDSGTETFTLNQPSIMRTIAWRPDGVAFAVAGDDQMVHIYDATPAYLVERAPQYLPQLDLRLSIYPKNSNDWHLRAEIDSRRDDWKEATTDAQHYLALNPDQRWLTLGYWVVGPYPDNLDAGYGPEIDPDTGHPAPGPGGEGSPALIGWRPADLHASGFIDFGQLFDHAEHISAYAVLRIYSPHPQAVAILLGSDDQNRVWLNGKRIHDSLYVGPAIPDNEAAPATLAPGWNTLLTRVVNVTGARALYLRLSDAPADLQRAQDQVGK